MEQVMLALVICVGLPWVILHYITKWKTAATLTTDDEALLEDLYQLAKRLDDRMETVERLVAADNPEFDRQRRLTDGAPDTPALRELDRLLAANKQQKGR